MNNFTFQNTPLKKCKGKPDQGEIPAICISDKELVPRISNKFIQLNKLH